MKYRIIMSGILALATVAGGACAAHAANAFATNDVNVRSGPDTSYAVVGVLGVGTRVQLGLCRAGWCSIEQGNLRGWASKSYLDKTRASVVVVPVPIIIHPRHYHKPRPHLRPRCKIAPGFPCR